jgi:hypothetical protein
MRLTLVVREGSVNLGGDTAGNDLEDLGTESDEETVHGVLALGGGVTGFVSMSHQRSARVCG